MTGIAMYGLPKTLVKDVFLKIIKKVIYWYQNLVHFNA